MQRWFRVRRLDTAQLVGKGSRDLGELEGARPGPSGDRGGVTGLVDVGVIVAGDGLEGVGGREASLVPARVVRAGVVALWEEGSERVVIRKEGKRTALSLAQGSLE